MKNLVDISSPAIIKTLADPRRLEILAILMSAPSSLTRLAEQLNQSPAWVRHHMLALQRAGLVEMDEIRPHGKTREKIYRARAGALYIHQIVLPKSKKPTILFAGSHDIALDEISKQLADDANLIGMPIGSLDGLINLRQGICHLSGVHLLDENGEYNLPFVRRLFPEQQVRCINLALRVQGLILAPGNPLSISTLQDLARPEIRLIQRNPGSGTRLWLDRAFIGLGVLPVAPVRRVNTHIQAAECIHNRIGDVALGLQAAAARFGLEFIPLFEEPYDLVFFKDQENLLQPILDFLQTRRCRQILSALPGYNVQHSNV
ncbi:MAG: substrate-binding domain-containing protein [Bellilinea sp.]|jgi:putative molybdopterin biosynthesis protein